MRWLLYHRHLLLGWAWILLAVPSVLWWKGSIVWVILLSLYANAEASFAAYNAQKADNRNSSGPAPSK